MEVTHAASFGTTTFAKPKIVEVVSPRDASQKITVSRARGEWRPPPRLLPFLPKDFKVPLECYTGADGLRRIVPCCNFEELIDLGAVGGLAVLHGLEGFDKARDATYHLMRLVHQHVCGRDYLGTRGMKEHLTREFNYSRDLYVRRSGRVSDDERDVLPDNIGVTAHGEGHRLTVKQLTYRGRQAAHEAGHANPTNRSAIRFGLDLTADVDPPDVKPKEVPALVRRAIFDDDSQAEPPSPELIEIVKERLQDAIRQHHADSRDDFYHWFLGAKNSLVKQIAQQKGKRGGKLSRHDVRRVLLHLGLRAYEYLGPCVHALMRTIKNSIPQALNDQEKQLFEHMYESQPYYGNLPAAMLAERMPDIKLAVLKIWEEPQNHRHVRVLHRLLAYYAEMVRKRRQADSQSKQRCPQVPAGALQMETSVEGNTVAGIAVESGSPPNGCSEVGSVQFVENLHSPAPCEPSPFAVIAEHLRQSHGIECEAGCTEWEYYRDGESDQPVTIRMRCECGQVDKAMSVTRKEFTKRAKEVLH